MDVSINNHRVRKLDQASDILFEQKQALGIITLNRPKALNALTWEMSTRLHRQLAAWATQTDLRAVVIKSDKPGCFCAGGDVRRVYDERQKLSSPYHSDFFRDEYRLNQAIFHFPKPYIALIDGLCLGGGMGVSVHGSHVVVSEHAELACPETRLGFFPDISASYFLSRCPGQLGRYLGLTGVRMNAADSLYTALAHHHVQSQQFGALLDALQRINFSNISLSDTAGAQRAVGQTLQTFASTPQAPGTLQPYRAAIDAAFSAQSVEAIIGRLQQCQNFDDTRGWAEHTLAELAHCAPLSLKVTLDLLIRAREMTMDECAELDYVLSQHFMQAADFFEGVRARLIDKDHAPRWQPASLEAVSPLQVANYFKKPSNLAP